MLGKAADLHPLLRCPKTGADLLRVPDGFATNDGVTYPVLGDAPVLIDRSSSMLAGVDGRSSPVRRTTSRTLGVVRRVIRPPNRATVRNIDAFIELLLDGVDRPRVLVIGGGTVGAGSERLYEHAEVCVYGLDVYDSSVVHIVADAHRIPVADEAFDGVLVQAVLEHVLSPVDVVAEIHRVLRPHGLVYSEIPFLQGVHEGAYDFTRYTESGHRWLYRSFGEVSSGVVSGPGSQLTWALAGLIGGLTRSRLAQRIASALFSVLRILDRAVPRDWSSDFACGTYFLGFKESSTVSERSMVDFYRGAQKGKHDATSQ